MLPLSRIVSQQSPWQMYTLATRSTRLFGVSHVSCCTRLKLIAGLTQFTGVVAAYTPRINACEVQQPLTRPGNHRRIPEPFLLSEETKWWLSSRYGIY